MTIKAALQANESREYGFVLTTSGNKNGGAGVPSGSIIDATAIDTSSSHGEQRSGDIVYILDVRRLGLVLHTCIA